MTERQYSSIAGTYALTSSVSASATSLDLSLTAGLPSAFPFTLVLDPGTTSEEIVTVTGLSGLTAAVIRGEDGSSAQTHQAGAVVRHMASARDFREPQQHIAATAAHGTSSDVVGVGDMQTLSNKTLDESTQVVVNGTTMALTDALGGGQSYANVLTSTTVPGPNLDTGLAVLSIPDPGFDYRVLASATVLSSLSSPAALYLSVHGTVVDGPATAVNLDVFPLARPDASQATYRSGGTGFGIKTYRGAATVRLSIDISDTLSADEVRVSALLIRAA